MSMNIGDFVAGWVAGVASLLVSYPFDTIKAQQQAYQISFLKAIRVIYKYQGISGFYNGILSPLITYGPSNSIFFGIYGNTLRYLKQNHKGEDEPEKKKVLPTDIVSLNQIMIAGTIAGIFQTVVYCPIEYVKIIIQVNTDYKGILKQYYNMNPYRNTFEAVVGIYKTSGLLGYYRGFIPMLVRDGPSGGIYMLIYEMICHSTIEQVTSLGPVGQKLFAGGAAGIVSIAPMIPFDVVKTHIQIDNPNAPRFKGFIDCFNKLYSQFGGRIFFQGLPVTCYRAFPSHAIMFMGYEFAMSLFQ